MAISESKKRANKKWNDKNMNVKYDHIHLVVQKGEKEVIQNHAKDNDESLNGFINRAIAEAMERDKYEK